MLLIKRICPKCRGYGHAECDCCGGEATCKKCEGEGFIPVKQEGVIAQTTLNISPDGTITLTQRESYNYAIESGQAFPITQPLDFKLDYAAHSTQWYLNYA